MVLSFGHYFWKRLLCIRYKLNWTLDNGVAHGFSYLIFAETSEPILHSLQYV
jgi:hypothetical protein